MIGTPVTTRFQPQALDVLDSIVGGTGQSRQEVILSLVAEHGYLRHAQSELVWDLVNALADSSEEKPRVRFSISFDGQVSAAVEPDHGIPLEQLVTVGLRRDGRGSATVELRGLEPEFQGVALAVATVPAGADAEVVVRLEDLDPELRMHAGRQPSSGDAE